MGVLRKPATPLLDAVDKVTGITSKQEEGETLVRLAAGAVKRDMAKIRLNSSDTDAIQSFTQNVFELAIAGYCKNFYDNNQFKAADRFEKSINNNAEFLANTVSTAGLKVLTDMTIYKTSIDECLKELTVKYANTLSPLLDHAVK